MWIKLLLMEGLNQDLTSINTYLFEGLNSTTCIILMAYSSVVECSTKKTNPFHCHHPVVYHLDIFKSMTCITRYKLYICFNIIIIIFLILLQLFILYVNQKLDRVEFTRLGIFFVFVKSLVTQFNRVWTGGGPKYIDMEAEAPTHI